MIGGDFGLCWAQPIQGGAWRGVVGEVAGTGGDYKSFINFDPEIADRIQKKNRSPIFPERILIGIMIAIEKINSGSDFKMKIAIRF